MDASEAQTILDHLSKKVGVDAFKIRIVNKNDVNATTSYVNKKIRLTKGALTNLSKQQLETMFAHEIGHIQIYNGMLISPYLIDQILLGILTLINLFHSFRLDLLFSYRTDIFLIVEAFIYLLYKLVYIRIMRHYEYKADYLSVKLVGYNNVTDLMEYFLPSYKSFPIYKKISFLLGKHPSFPERIKRIKKREPTI